MRSKAMAACAAALLVSALAMAHAAAGRAPAGSGARPRQSSNREESGELLATLATGQIEIYVGRDGVAIGILANAFEPGSHPPLLVSLGMGRVAVLMGAVDWFSPENQRHVRLDTELPRLVVTSAAGRPSLGAAPADDAAIIGIELLEPLRKLAAGLHAAIELPAGTPLVAIALVGYKHGEGASVRELDFKLVQEPLRGDFYQTLVDRPERVELYPAGRKARGDAIALSYPPGSSPALAGLLAKNDPRLGPAISTAAGANTAKLIEQGETRKAPAAALAEFLRGALPAVAKPGASAAVALLNDAGLQWVLAPPEKEQPPREKETGEKPRPPGAPTLEKPPQN